MKKEYAIYGNIGMQKGAVLYTEIKDTEKRENNFYIMNFNVVGDDDEC